MLTTSPESEYAYVNDQLQLDGVDLRTLAHDLRTPAYAYSASTIAANVALVRGAFPRASVFFAVKANSSMGVLGLLRQLDVGFDVVSGGELFRTLQVGTPPSSIVFSGVGKTEDELRQAIHEGVFAINVESENELRSVATAASSLGRQARICLRVNPDVDAGTHQHITTGKKDSKFGIPIPAALELARRWSKEPAVLLCGVHVHIGSQICSPQPYVRAITKVCGLVRQLRAEGISISCLNLGGGFGIDYGDQSAQPAAPAIKEFAAAIDAALNDALGADVPQIMIEPGRFIVGNAGVLLAQVVNLKTVEGRNFAVLDAGMNDLMRPGLYGAYHRIVPLRRAGATQEPSQKYDVVGPVCESTDRFGVQRDLPGVQAGDYVAILDAGAYSFSLASNYNSRPRPCEALLYRGQVDVIRKRESLEDLIRLERKSTLTLDVNAISPVSEE